MPMAGRQRWQRPPPQQRPHQRQPRRRRALSGLATAAAALGLALLARTVAGSSFPPPPPMGGGMPPPPPPPPPPSSQSSGSGQRRAGPAAAGGAGGYPQQQQPPPPAQEPMGGGGFGGSSPGPSSSWSSAPPSGMPPPPLAPGPLGGDRYSEVPSKAPEVGGGEHPMSIYDMLHQSSSEPEKEEQGQHEAAAASEPQQETPEPRIEEAVSEEEAAPAAADGAGGYGVEEWGTPKKEEEGEPWGQPEPQGAGGGWGEEQQPQQWGGGFEQSREQQEQQWGGYQQQQPPPQQQPEYWGQPPPQQQQQQQWGPPPGQYGGDGYYGQPPPPQQQQQGGGGGYYYGEPQQGYYQQPPPYHHQQQQGGGGGGASALLSKLKSKGFGLGAKLKETAQKAMSATAEVFSSSSSSSQQQQPGGGYYGPDGQYYPPPPPPGYGQGPPGQQQQAPPQQEGEGAWGDEGAWEPPVEVEEEGDGAPWGEQGEGEGEWPPSSFPPPPSSDGQEQQQQQEPPSSPPPPPAASARYDEAETPFTPPPPPPSSARGRDRDVEDWTQRPRRRYPGAALVKGVGKGLSVLCWPVTAVTGLGRRRRRGQYEMDDFDALASGGRYQPQQQWGEAPSVKRRGGKRSRDGLGTDLALAWGAAPGLTAGAVLLSVLRAAARVGAVVLLGCWAERSVLNDAFDIGTEPYEAALMKQSLLWALAFLAATLLAQLCTALLHTLTTHLLPLPLAAHLRTRLPPLQHAAPAITARLHAGLTSITSTLTLVLLPAALLFPGLVENWPAFLTVSLPAVRLSLERVGEIHPSIAHILTTKLLPLHPSLPQIFAKSLTTPTIHLTPLHIIPFAALLSLVALWTSGSCVPERWARHGTAPAWVDEGEEYWGVDAVVGEERGQRTLEGEVARLLQGKGSMAEVFEVGYRGLGPVLRRKKAEMDVAGRKGGVGEGAGGLRRAKEAVQDGARRVGGIIATVVWHTQTLLLLAAFVGAALYCVHELNRAVAQPDASTFALLTRGEWAWMLGAVALAYDALREGRGAAREAVRLRALHGLKGVYRALESHTPTAASSPTYDDMDQPVMGLEHEPSGWATDGPVKEDGVRLDGLWIQGDDSSSSSGGNAADDFILKDVSLHVKPGQVLLLCGSEGSGKSLLLRALAGGKAVDPRRIRGQLSFQGRLLEEWDSQAWKARVAYLPGIEASASFPLLTIGENIYPPSLAEGGSGDREVWQAAARKAGGVEALVARLRDGYYTELGDSSSDCGPRARPLSGGEWRRIQLARALALNPRSQQGASQPQLVLLDDPTLLMSDAEAKAFMSRLRRAVKEEWGNPVVVIASQRPVLAAYADQVAILDGGRVLQYGSPREIVPAALLGGGGGQKQPQPQQQRRQPQAGGYNRQQQQQQVTAPASSSTMPPARTRGVRWGGGSTTSNSDNEDEVYLFERES